MYIKCNKNYISGNSPLTKENSDEFPSYPLQLELEQE